MLHCRVECWKMLVGHLAVWGWLLICCCAQNHSCPRIETVEERVAVPHQEPVTFRSYTWCLKVPPRCSKYTVIMRERITYQTEVRNQTVMECCPGYVSMYGSCVAECPGCRNMRCDKARNCLCTPGFTGVHCNQTCEAGKWGNRCSEACICRLEEDCDPVTGICTVSSTTTLPSTSKAKKGAGSSGPTTKLPRTSTRKPHATTSTPQQTIQTLTTQNSFIDLTRIEPTTSAEDLTDFNIILKQKLNDTVKLTNNNNDENSLNALGELDYPVLPTDSAIESYNLNTPEPEPKNIVVNSLSVNSSVVNDRWISELGASSGITLGSALALIALLVVTVSAVIRCHNNKKAVQQTPPLVEKTSLHLVARNSHYAVPGPPSFSFINGYLQDSLEREQEDDNYDHPRSVRCLADNEPVYDELRY